MKIYIVTHEHNEGDSESRYCNIVSAHLSREKAEKSVAEAKKECLSEYWEGYESDENAAVDKDLAGWFKIYNENGYEDDEIIINEVDIKD